MVWLLVRFKSQLSRAGIDFHEIDIEDRADGAAVVAQVNDGNHRIDGCLPRWICADQPVSGQVGLRLGSSILVRQRRFGQPALGTQTVVASTRPVRGPVVSRCRLSMKSSSMCQSAVSMKRVRP